MTLPLRRVTVALALAVGLATVAVPSAVGATTTHHPTAISYVEHSADGDLARVRQYFLCSSATCKHDHAALKTAAASSMGRLRTQGAALRPARAAHVLRPALTLFVADVRLLETSYRAYFTATSSVKVSGLVGNVFYLTEDLASDVNVVKAAATKKKVSFSLWVVGEAATLLAMQTDAKALQSSSATTAVGIYANQLLEAESHQLLAHAGGPNASFDHLLRTFASHQLTMSHSEILYLEGKKAPLSEHQIASLNSKVAQEFATLIKDETSLVKK